MNYKVAVFDMDGTILNTIDDLQKTGEGPRLRR